MDEIYIIIILLIAPLILYTILFFKIWGMCNDVNDIKHLLKQNVKETHIITQVVEQEEGHLKEGQLVIVKADESQFRITGITKKDGEILYFSNKFNKYFKENEIIDFDEYWRKRK